MGDMFSGIGSALGIDGGQKEYFQPNNKNDALAQLNQRNGVYSPGVNAGIAGYGNGSMSLQDALSRASGGDNAQDAMRDALVYDPQAGSRMATDEVMNNAIQGRMYGAGADSAMSQALAQQRDLSSRGFQLTPEDHEAYGQASGNIARMFGGMENQATQSLADRGLASAPSGAAGAMFSGLAGNKYEQLAKSQMDIAQQRMANTTQRLQMANQNVQALGGQANSAINDQYGRQLQGVNAKRNSLFQNAQAQIAQNQAENEANNASMNDKRSAKAPTLGEAFGKGLLSSSAKFGDSPGTGSEAFSKSFGSTMGAGAAGGA